MRIDRGIELVSIADVPANSGLGSSGAFTVSLLNVLHAYKGETPSREQLAEEAAHLEIDVLQEPVGRQDPVHLRVGRPHGADVHPRWKGPRRAGRRPTRRWSPRSSRASSSSTRAWYALPRSSWV